MPTLDFTIVETWGVFRNSLGSILIGLKSNFTKMHYKILKNISEHRYVITDSIYGLKFVDYKLITNLKA